MSAFTSARAPYGPSAPSRDVLPYSAADSGDVAQIARAFTVLTDGVVSVTTEAGMARTWTAKAGMMFPDAIQGVLAATTADLLLHL